MLACPYLIELLTPGKDSPSREDDLIRFAARYRRIHDAGGGISIPDHPMGRPRIDSRLFGRFAMKRLPNWIGICCILLLFGCVGSKVQHTTVRPSHGEPEPPAAVFECEDGQTITVRFENGSAVLSRGEKTLHLDRVPAASGAKYSDGAATFWTKGREAVLNLPDETGKTCALQKPKSVWETARLRGVDFRAIGNEPGWYLEITFGRRIRMVTDYGNRRLSFPAPSEPLDPGAAQTTIRARTADHRLEVVIANDPCRDSMSGEKFEATVRATLDGISFSGCGRSLR